MALVRVGVLSDTRLFSEGVSQVVRGEASLHLMEVGDEAALLAAPPAYRPNVLLLDARMDRAIALCKGLGGSGDPRVIALAVPHEGPLAADLLIAGARGILYPSARSNEVIDAIALVLEGKIWAPRHVVASAWQKCMPHVDVGQRIAGWQRLSAREREVVRYAASGFANKELASRLAISEATVKVHLTHIFQKVGCRSRTELAAAYHGVGPIGVERPTRRPSSRAS